MCPDFGFLVSILLLLSCLLYPIPHTITTQFLFYPTPLPAVTRCDCLWLAQLYKTLPLMCSSLCRPASMFLFFLGIRVWFTQRFEKCLIKIDGNANVRYQENGPDFARRRSFQGPWPRLSLIKEVWQMITLKWDVPHWAIASSLCGVAVNYSIQAC